ncbi:MAG TPA: SPW repeat protein [Thermomicrobiaceae bacterium]|nr:SPW repeat protein [Thermomicrobiaceae bacterium]
MDWQEAPVPPRVKTAAIVIIVFAVWGFISPFALHYNHMPTALWTTVGLVIVSAFLVGIRVSGAQRAGWLSLLNAIFGILLIATPFVIGEAGDMKILINDIVVGAVITAMALYAVSGTDTLVSGQSTREHA